VTVDADTLLEKNALATILARRESSGAACVAGNLLVADTNRWVQRMQISDQHRRRKTLPGQLWRYFGSTGRL
jgi:GT2 family glycosyltransferase